LEKSKGLTITTGKRELYLTTFLPFFQDVRLFGGSVEATLTGQFGRVASLEKSKGLTTTTSKRELYLTTFHPFSQGVRLFGGSVEAALTLHKLMLSFLTLVSLEFT
jgi:hypothetical protein